MMKTEGKRARPGDFFLLAVLLANLVCGVGLIGASRADLSKDLVADESTLASSKISAYLWGKVLRFTSAVEKGRRLGESATPKGDADGLTIASDLPVNEKFQRIRSGTGESLPVFIGAPRDLPNRGRVLPLAFLVDGGTGQDPYYVIGTISLADIDGYLGDLRRRGIHCRIVDTEGNTLFGAGGEFPGRRDSVSRFDGVSPLMVGALSREWSLQMYIPDAGSRLPFLPQAILATFFLLNMVTLVFLRQRFILPADAALETVSETVVAQGEILPPVPPPRILPEPSTVFCRVAVRSGKMRTGRSGRAQSDAFGRSPNPKRTCCRTTDSPKSCSNHARPTKSSRSSSPGLRTGTVFPVR